MPRFFLVVAVVLAAAAPARAQQPAASSSSPTLDFDYFRTRVQPIFTTKRDGNARCVSCHEFGTPMRLQRLRPTIYPLRGKSLVFPQSQMNRHIFNDRFNLLGRN